MSPDSRTRLNFLLLPCVFWVSFWRIPRTFLTFAGMVFPPSLFFCSIWELYLMRALLSRIGFGRGIVGR